MQAALPSLVGLLLWGSCAQAEVAVQPGFDNQKFAGIWNVVGGISNCPTFQSMKDTMKTSAALIKPFPSGDLQITTGYPLPEECKKMEMHYTKTDLPGHYTSHNEKATMDTRVMETDYTSFAFVYIFKEPLDKAEPSSTTIQLYTRAPDVSPEVLEKFKKHSHDVGLTDDMMALPPKSDTCFKALSA